ncbi:hypothetical protein B0F90DRAFT_1737505 [Multifurca ochricompacta]|uniref:Uncharacterized protein n=1 Tax=Multifurca ochricompacta TaxID=376703 RepID=A0AAD4M1C5_9AGAM|nr:hypothetical protein B0F90DRAFT_1737505 [Multifurca ochricompacta]
MHGSFHVTLLLASFTYAVAITGVRNHWSDPYSLRPNPLYPYPRSPAAGSTGNASTSGSRFWKGSTVSPSRTRPSKLRAALRRRQYTSDDDTAQLNDLDTRPTPMPTGEPSVLTTVHITNENDFALLLPVRPGELVSESEADAQSFCTPGGSSSESCTNTMPDGLIAAAALQKAEDGSWIQVTGCLDASKFHFVLSDTGGQLDVRFPNGAQCTFGGEDASFIELVEPALNRFCLRCCLSANDQVNCNSHRDRTGCENAIPGTYNFPDLGVSCA